MSTRRVLVTGAVGFVGRHMVSHLLDRGYHVSCLDQCGSVDLPPAVEQLSINLSDAAAVMAIPKRWWGVIHLAAASVPSLFSTTAPILGNLEITLNLLDHLEAARVLIVSSCHVYAPAAEPRREDDVIIPHGRYGLSKHLCEQLIPHYLYRLDLRVARPFNHLGPGQRSELVIPTLLRRLAEHPRGDASPMLMKGMNSIRDFIDVRDVASAYLAILELDAPSQRTFNVCTGNAHSIEEVIHTAQSILGTERGVCFENRPNSSDDIPYLVGDPTRLQLSTGWHPRFSLPESLHAMIDAIHS